MHALFACLPSIIWSLQTSWEVTYFGAISLSAYASRLLCCNSIEIDRLIYRIEYRFYRRLRKWKTFRVSRKNNVRLPNAISLHELGSRGQGRGKLIIVFHPNFIVWCRQTPAPLSKAFIGMIRMNNKLIFDVFKQQFLIFLSFHKSFRTSSPQITPYYFIYQHTLLKSPLKKRRTNSLVRKLHKDILRSLKL